MKNLLISIFFALSFLFTAPASADNASLFAQIQADTAELQALLQAVSDGEIDYGWGFVISIPAATRLAMRTRMQELRTNIKANLNALTIE